MSRSRIGDPFGIDAARGDQHGRLLALYKAAAVEAERHPLADDVVDPCLQRGRDVVVIHRCGDDNVVGGEDFADQLIDRRSACFISGECCSAGVK